MKKLLIAILIIVALVVVAAVVTPFFVPVDAFKAKLIAAVKQSTGRDLRIDGPVSFHLLPNIELSADQVSFSNAPGGAAKNMAQLKSLEVRLQLLPLLSGTVAVDTFVLVDPVIALEVEKDGRPNWEFSTTTATTAPAPAATAHAPAASGGGAMTTLARLRLANLAIENGTVSYVDTRSGKRWEADAINLKIAMAGLDSPMSASGSVAWNKQTVNVDLSVNRPAAFEGGQATPIKLKIASSPINFSFTGSGVGAPTLKLDGDADLNIPSLRSLAAWAGQPMPAGNGFGLLAIKGKVAIAGAKYAFSNAVVAFDAIKGNGGIEFDNGGAKPYIKGSLQLDDLNLNPYLGATSGSGATPAPSGAAGGTSASGEQGWSTTPIDTSALKVADADFFLGANSVEYHNIKVGKSALIVHLKDARLAADLTQLTLYKGTGQGKVTVDGSGATPAIEESFALKGVDMQPLLHDAANVNLLSGSGSLDMAVDGRGRSQRDIISSLAGKGSLHLDKGKIEGVNIIGIMKNAAKALSMGLVGSGNDTDFSTLSGTYTITNGVLKNNDLQLVSSELPMTGAGTIDLPQRQVNYRLTPKVAGALAVPVLISGPWDHLSYRPDVGAMLQQSGQQLLQQPGKTLQQVVPNQLQNLFGK
ncbi:MAG: AsmA family protein [Alphaproteobacteria bacterium]|nr:AsmA family protein [Alphaproteobacteria bacterium]